VLAYELGVTHKLKRNLQVVALGCIECVRYLHEREQEIKNATKNALLGEKPLHLLRMTAMCGLAQCPAFPLQ
jgi:hypothetical protein